MPASSAHPPWFDARMPAREACVLPALIERRAASAPEAMLVQFENGTQWSCEQTLHQMRSTAAALRALGVVPGDKVVVWLPNGPDLLRVWFAINFLGATFVPVHTNYRGNLLQHAIEISDAALVIVHAELAQRLTEIKVPKVHSVVICGGAVPQLNLKARVLGSANLLATEELTEAYPAERWDVMMIIFTSGTTGPSKGVLTTYLQQYLVGQGSFGYLGAADRMLVNLPLYHISAVSAVIGSIANGASIALFESFSTQGFWSDIRRTGATSISGLLGSLISFLLKNPPQSDDADNPLKRVVLAPVNQQTLKLAERYNFEYFTGFNMTELSVPLVSDVNTHAFGSCGRPRSGVECRIVDENDIELETGAVGEFIVRSDLPWTMNSGYVGMPEATALAWRNGWFHTGDLMYRDANDNFFYVDRRKDAIRRRGENISSVEVEVEVDEYPGVAEVAAIGVPSPDGEDEVMVVIAAKPEMQVEPAELIQFLLPRMAGYMVPRYVRLVTTLPRTPTNKIQKAKLRAEGITADTWDREAAGIRVQRQRFNSKLSP